MPPPIRYLWAGGSLMMIRGGTAVVVMAVAFGLAGLSAAPQGNKRVYWVPAEVTFADRAGDAITSDGGGAYVTAQLFTLSTQDLSLNLSGEPRSINFDLNGLISGTGAPTGTLADQAKMNIVNIGSMGLGATKITRAIFNTVTGQFNFDQAADAQTFSVSVTRVDQQSWTVSTDGGDAAVLVRAGKANKTIKVGYYHLPFQLTVVCPSC